MTSSMWVLVVAVLATTRAKTPPQTVAVIGAGIGGGSFSYYYKKLNPSAQIVAFESRDYIGGRLKHINVHNTTIELGGDAWSTVANHYIVQIARELGGHPGRRTRPLRSGVTDPPLAGIGIWNGTGVTPIGPLLEHLRDDILFAEMESRFLLDLDRNYRERGDTGTFNSIEDFLQHGSLSKYTTVTATSFYTHDGFSSVDQDLLLEPLARAIYNQNLDDMQAFSAIVAPTSVLGADQFDGGNSLLVEKMFQAANAEVHLRTRVMEVRREGGGYTVTPQSANPITVDAVVVACPIEFVNVSFPTGVQLPKSRPYRHIFVTIVRATGLQPSYFGLGPQDTQKFNNILTSRKANATTPFVVVEQETVLPDKTELWKLFSNEDVRPHLNQIFVGVSTNPSDIIVQSWPYTFPELVPITKTSATQYQPLTLDNGIHYINAMESVASAMEGSIIGGRNVALTLAQAQ